MKKLFLIFIIITLICSFLVSCVSEPPEESKAESQAESMAEVSVEESDVQEVSEESADEVSDTQTSIPAEQSEVSTEPLKTLVLPVVGGNVNDEVYRNRLLTEEEIEIFKLLEGYWQTWDEQSSIYFDFFEPYNGTDKYIITLDSIYDGSNHTTYGKIIRIYVTGEFEITVAVFYPEYIYIDRPPSPEHTELYVFDLSRLYTENIIFSNCLGEYAEYKKSN